MLGHDFFVNAAPQKMRANTSKVESGFYSGPKIV